MQEWKCVHSVVSTDWEGAPCKHTNTHMPACVSSNGHVSPSSDTSVLTEDFKCRGVKDRPGLTHVWPLLCGRCGAHSLIQVQRYKQCKSKDRANCPTATADRKYLYRNAKYAGVTKHASIKSMHQRALKQQVPLTAELALWETQMWGQRVFARVAEINSTAYIWFVII